MNQEKIVKFISQVRKKKKITQKQLAEKLGITDRAVSKWENGKSMPDLSLLKPICNILDITVNELLSGEHTKEEKGEKKLEENIVNAIYYSNKRQDIYELIFHLFVLLFGSLMIMISLSIFCTPIGFTMGYSIIGTYILMIIFSFLLKRFVTKNKSRKFVIILIISFFVLYFGYLWVIDFVNVKTNGGNPDIFVVSSTVTDDFYSYDTFFYDLHICNFNQENEYRKLVFNINHSIDIDKIKKLCK